MGRTKVQIRSIEDPARRKTTFMKRNAGVMKKAMELSVLCHCEVALVIFDEHGNLHQFASKDLHPTFNRVLSHRGTKDVLPIFYLTTVARLTCNLTPCLMNFYEFDFKQT